MHVIALTSYKGGVGKTTVALNLAHALATRGWRTLLVDGDPQGSVGFSLRKDIAESAGLAECLRGETRLGEATVATRVPELTLLPAGRATPEDLARWYGGTDLGSELSTLLSEAEDHHDLVILDTPGGGSAATTSLMAAADALLLLIQAEPLAVRAVPRFLELLQAGSPNPDGPRLAGVLLTMVQTRVSYSLSVVQEVLSLFPSSLTLEAFVPRDPLFLEASAKGVPVKLLRRDPPPVAAVFDQIAAEVEQRFGLLTGREEVDDEPLALLD